MEWCLEWKYFGWKLIFEWKYLMLRLVWLVFIIDFRIGMTMPLQSADLYLRYGWLDMEWFVEFALLFSSGGDPISGTYKFWPPSEGYLISGMRTPNGGPTGEGFDCS